MLSHGVLDAMTFGGRGVGFFWPFVDSREFFPWRPLPVSVIGIERFFKYFDNWGAYVLKTEFYRVWLPMIGFAKEKSKKGSGRTPQSAPYLAG